MSEIRVIWTQDNDLENRKRGGKRWRTCKTRKMSLTVHGLGLSFIGWAKEKDTRKGREKEMGYSLAIQDLEAFFYSFRGVRPVSTSYSTLR